MTAAAGAVVGGQKTVLPAQARACAAQQQSKPLATPQQPQHRGAKHDASPPGNEDTPTQRRRTEPGALPSRRPVVAEHEHGHGGHVGLHVLSAVCDMQSGASAQLPLARARAPSPAACTTVLLFDACGVLVRAVPTARVLNVHGTG